MTLGPEEKDRMLLALDRIAENTKPREETLLRQTQAERDKNAEYIKTLAKFLEDFAYELEAHMLNPDMMERSKGIRGVMSAMHEVANRFKPPEAKQ